MADTCDIDKCCDSWSLEMRVMLYFATSILVCTRIVEIILAILYMIIHVFGEVQGPTSTGDLHDEYLKNIFESSHKPQNY